MQEFEARWGSSEILNNGNISLSCENCYFRCKPESHREDAGVRCMTRMQEFEARGGPEIQHNEK